MGDNRPVLRVLPGAASPEAGRMSFDAAYARFSPYVAAIAVRITGRDADVDDLVQEAFLALARRFGDAVPSDEDARRFLVRVVIRASARQLGRRRLRDRFFVRDPGPALAVAATSLSPEERVTLERLYAVLARLPARQRIAWVLRHLEGESLPEVATLCGTSLASIKRWIAAAHAAVEKALGADGGAR